MISLQSTFCTLAPISVLYVDIYSSSLRLFKIDLVVSLLAATRRQYSILVLSLPLRWLRVTFVLNTSIAFKRAIFQPRHIAARYICFKYLDCVKRAIFQPRHIAQRIDSNVLVIL